MRKAFLFMMLVVCNVVIAQVKISGKLIASDNNPIEYAEVVLFSEASVPLTNQLTNEKGEFSMEYPQGTYQLEIRYLEKQIHSQTIVLNSDYDAGIIAVNTTNTLETVVISKSKELIERKVDRLVFNVENTISATGGDALDALRITPGVLVRNDNITIIGKQTIRVLIDDKMLELGEGDLANFLRSIPAENIKSIEVITTPPAKYDAAGGSGLLNIKLKKAKKNSWSLSLGSSYLRRSEAEEAITSNFMYNKNKLSLTSSLNYRDGGEFHNYRDKVSFPDELWDTKQGFNRKYKRLNAVLGMQYAVTSEWVFGFQYIANLNKTKSHRNTKSMVYVDHSEASYNDVISTTDAYQKPEFNSINFFNEIKLDSVGKKIILNLDYFQYSNQDTRPYEGTSEIKNPYAIQYFRGINDNRQTTNNYSGKIDVELPTKWASWSTGGKISISKTENNIAAFNSGLVDNPVIDMPQIAHKFDYDENVQALYFSGNKKFKNNLEAQIGLRMEATQTKSYDGNRNQSVYNKYTKLFPSFNLSYSPTENSTYRFNYGKRVGRPNFSEMNPNATFINPFLTVEGNPVLKPFFIDNFELIHSYKKLESKLYYSIENNIFNQISLPGSNTNTIRLTFRNIYDVKRIGISEFYVFDKFSWWSSNTMFDINYITSKTIDLEGEGLSGFSSYFSSNNNFNLNKDKTVLFSANFGYTFPGTYGLGKEKPSSSTSLTMQYLLLNKDLKITLRANDIFKTERFRFDSTVNGVYRNSDYYFDARFVQLSLNYKFGNKKVDSEKRRAGNEEERARTGN